MKEKDKIKVSIEDVISNPSAERSLISLCMQYPIDTLSSCSAEDIFAEHFNIDINKELYGIICYLVNEGQATLDTNIIYTKLSSEMKEILETYGGVEYLEMLFSTPINKENTMLYIRSVKNCALKRMLFYMSKDLQDMVMKTGNKENASELLENAQRTVLDISIASSSKSEVHKAGVGLADRLKARAEAPTEVFGYKVGWNKFDKVTQGAQGNDLIVIVGESKTGKSTLLENWSVNLSIKSLLEGLYIDTEMSDEEWEDRMVAMISGVPFEEIRNGFYAHDTEYGEGRDKINRVNEATRLIVESKLWHVYMPDFTIDKVTAIIRKFKIQEDIKYCVFDYIKMPNDDIKGLSNAQEYQRLGYFTTCLKDMAGICGIPIITACQSNRTSISEEEPDATAIGGSYRILQLASKLFFLKNKTPERLVEEGYRFGNQVLHIKYQRNGSSGEKINIQSDFPICRMREVS